MKSFLSRRPSPALVISMIALFVSLSGVSYGVATGFIDSRELKNNQVRSVDLRNNDIRTRDLRNNEVRGLDIRNSTVQGADVALNTLTGDDINESRLGKVPSAAAADSATTAGSAQNVRAIAPTSVASGAAPVTLATHGPLTIALRCVAEMGGFAAVVTVSSSTDNSSALGVAPPRATPISMQRTALPRSSRSRTRPAAAAVACPAGSSPRRRAARWSAGSSRSSPTWTPPPAARRATSC